MPSYDPDPFAYLMRQSTRRGGTSPDVLLFSGDLARNVFVGGALADQITFTRASIASDLLPEHPPGRGFTTFQINEPVIVTGVGGYSFEASTQYLDNPVNPSAPELGKALAVGNYTLWCNALPDGSMTVNAGTAVLGGAGTARHGQPIVFRVVVAGTVDIIRAGTVYAAQLESGDTPTPFMPVGGMTRANDAWNHSAAVIAAANNAAGTLLNEIRLTDGTGSTRTGTPPAFPQFNTQTVGFNTALLTLFNQDSGGGNSILHSQGTGGLRDPIVHVESWSPSSRRVIANNGMLATSTRLRTGTISTLRPINAQTNGIIKRWAYYAGQKSDAEMRALLPSVAPAAFILGDSLGITEYATPPATGRSLSTMLSAATGKAIVNYSVYGLTAAQSLARLQASGVPSGKAIIELGTNYSATTVADIASIVAMLPPGTDYMIISMINRDTTSGRSGGTEYTDMAAQNATLASTYGARFLDARALLIAAANLSDGYDAQCVAWDVQPASLRRIESKGYLAAAIADASTQTFTLPFSPGNGNVVKVGSEYIFVTTASGANVTVCTRGFAGSTASAHPVSDPCLKWDGVHQIDAGRKIITDASIAATAALGWVW